MRKVYALFVEDNRFYLDEETIRTCIESFRIDGIPDLKIFRYKSKQPQLGKDQLVELKLHLSGKIYLYCDVPKITKSMKSAITDLELEKLFLQFPVFEQYESKENRITSDFVKLFAAKC